MNAWGKTMVRRVIENALVAVVASAVTWAASHPGESAGTAATAVDRILSSVAKYGAPLTPWLWSSAVALAVTAVLLQALSMAPRNPDAAWDWSVSMPSAPTSLISLGVALVIAASAIGRAAAASGWALVLIALLIYMACRRLSWLRHRWNAAIKGL